MEETSLEKYQNPKLSSNVVVNTNVLDPVCMLSEIFGKIAWKSTLVAGVHNKCCFKVSTFVDGKQFSSTGITLKMARKACAISALANYNETNNNEKRRPNVLVLDACNQNLCDKVMIFDDQKRKVRSNTMPLIIEEIQNDYDIENKKVKNFKALRKVTNLAPSSSSSLKIPSKMSELENDAIQSKSKTAISKNMCNKENQIMTDLKYMLENKLKSVNVTEKTLTTSKFSTMDLVNLQTVEMKVCIKSFAKNPLKSQNLLTDEEHRHESLLNNQEKCLIPRLKRPREEDDQELIELPQAKRRATTTVGKWCQQKSNAFKYLRNLYPNLKFTLEAKVGTMLVPYFMVSAMLGDRKFHGHGKTKFFAKNDAAIQILNYLENNQTSLVSNIGQSRIQANNQSCECIILPNIPDNEENNRINLIKNSENSRVLATNQNFQRAILPNTPEDEEGSSLLLPTKIADIIEAKIVQKFHEITSRRQESREYKVLAGILMTFNMNFENSIVVSVATGTKCINGGNICCNGSVLNDSHAEIIAKRGLMKFLYAQLKCHCDGDSHGNSIFRTNPNSLQMPYSLKPYVDFHLYINTAPCGDARVYSFSRINSFNSAQCGQLRTKVEGEMGTNPVGARYYPQTWDGVVLGEPLHTMSCSDKIALWNVVGVQGSLLSQLIDPIYLHSIVLGSMFNAQHMYRAICGRIEHTLGFLPQSYRLNRPLLASTSRSLRRSTWKAPSIGINWTLGDSEIEIISLPTGRTINNEISILSKRIFFSKFIYLCKNLPNVDFAYVSDNYAAAKENSKAFQKSKRAVFEAFYRADLGTWVKKPIIQNDFILN